MRVIDEEKKNLIYRNLLESINDILPRIPLVTVMLLVCRDSKDFHLRSEMRCEEMVKVLDLISFHAQTLRSDRSFIRDKNNRKHMFNLNVTAGKQRQNPLKGHGKLICRAIQSALQNIFVHLKWK